MYVDLDGVNEIDSSQWSKPSFDTYIPKADFQKKIAFGAEKDLNLNGRDVSYLSRGYQDGVEDLFSNTMWGGETVIARKHEASAEAGVSVTLGANEGTKFEFYVSGEVSKDNSNVHVDVTTRDDGRTTIDVLARANPVL